MFIDRDKVFAKSKSYGSGYKGIIPKFKRAELPRERLSNFARIAIGWGLVAALVGGTVALIYTLATEGNTAVKRVISQKENPPQKSPFYKVNFIPKERSK